MSNYDKATPINLYAEPDEKDQDKEWGWITITERVNNGYMTWFETQRYLYYSPNEARALFLEHIKDKGWTIEEDL